MKTFIGKFRIKHYRDGKLIGEQESYNNATIQGMKRILDVMFRNISPGNLSVGLVSSSPAPVFSVNDTITSHSGWTELVVQAGYPQLVQMPAQGRTTITDQTTGPADGAEFTVATAGTVRGTFVFTADGLFLWSESLVAPIVLAVGDNLFVTYEVSIT